jgi:hypothetical protein
MSGPTANETAQGRQRKSEKTADVLATESIRHVLNDPKAHHFLAWLREAVLDSLAPTYADNPTVLAYRAGRHDTLRALDLELRRVDAEAFGKHLALRMRDVGEKQITKREAEST